MLSKFTNKTYGIVSYATYEDRYSDFEKTLNNSFELVVAPKQKYFSIDDVEFNKGAKSLISANESIFLKEKLIKNETFMIVEDDILLVDNYENLLESLFNEIPTDWDILSIGYHVNTPLNIIKLENSNLPYYKLIPYEEIVGTHALIYKKSVVDFILNEVESINEPWDWFLFKRVYPKFNTYISTQKIVYQQSYREIEIDKNAYYKKFKSKIKYDS